MHFCTLKFAMLEKSPDFYCDVHSVRLLASSPAYLSSDVYR